ncbi:MAG: D-glycero-beta-D-manno-heptose-7-phosphate kinase [Terriglobia bacterium]|nr:MAG: D-glycero-beta-D-manno-heptose-7-phosphate kinase [Terriglobia bacterium]
MRPQSTDHFLELIDRFSGKRMLVMGDLMLDEFISGRVSRISPEAPVPVVNVTRETYYPGGAANVARNLREFTQEISVAGVAGTDAAGERLLQLLGAAKIRTTGTLRDPDAVTTVKTRVIARNQQVVRVDRERPKALAQEQLAEITHYLERAVPEVDGIIVADYGKGFVTQPLADEVCRLARAHRKILTVDPHPHTCLTWRGVTAIKPNRLELFSAARLPATEPVEPVSNDQALLDAARCLRSVWQSESLLVTLGDQGMLLFEGEQAPLHLAARAREVFDVSGAGDTAVAVFTLGLVSGATPSEAAELANRASGIVVGKFGTATVTYEDLAAAFRAPNS